jgi:hypothetical protein
LALSAQTLRLTGASGSSGEEVSVKVLLTSPVQAQPSTLQWELTVPSTQLALIGDPQPGPEAKAAGKSITCRAKTKADNAQTSTCLVFGGREPIHNGVIGILQLKIAADAKAGSARIRIDQALAVTKDLKRTTMPAVEAVITIRKK